MNLQSNYESIPKSSTHTHTHPLIFLFSNCLVTNENSPTSHTDSTPLDIAGSGVSVTTTGTGAACTGAGLFQGPEDFSMPPPPPPPPPSSQLLPGSSLFSVTSSSFSLPYLLCLNSKAAVIKLFLFEFFPFIFILGQGLGGGPGTPDTTPAERGRCSLWQRPAAPLLLVPHNEEVVQARLLRLGRGVVRPDGWARDGLSHWGSRWAGRSRGPRGANQTPRTGGRPPREGAQPRQQGTSPPLSPAKGPRPAGVQGEGRINLFF